MSNNPAAAPPRKDYDKIETAGVVTATAAPAVSATPMVEVVAPATLPGGYKFDADIGNGAVISVDVPPGGVEEGQRFMVPAVLPTASTTTRASVPVGNWKDGIFDCCKFGCCHPQCCLTYWCPVIALGQVMHRMKLNFYGVPAPISETSGTFKKVMIIAISAYVINYGLGVMQMATINGTEIQGYDAYGNPQYELSASYYAVLWMRIIFALGYFIYVLAALINTRSHIRQKYAISEQFCSGCDDFLCSWFCSSCSICQMARHTADYELYSAACCTENGLPPHVPDPIES